MRGRLKYGILHMLSTMQQRFYLPLAFDNLEGQVDNGEALNFDFFMIWLS